MVSPVKHTVKGFVIDRVTLINDYTIMKKISAATIRKKKLTREAKGTDITR